MGLTKDLKKQNATESQILATAKHSISEDGYNVNNIPQLSNQQPSLMTIEERNHIHQVAIASNNETTYLQHSQNQSFLNPGHLQKPSVPTDGVNSDILHLLLKECGELYVCEICTIFIHKILYNV